MTNSTNTNQQTQSNNEEPKFSFDPVAMFESLLTSKSMGDKVMPPRWLIKGLVEQNKLSCLFGPSGSMKSFLTMAMGLCIAKGLSFYDQYTEQGDVLYICGEGKEGINQRIKAWEKEFNNDERVENFFVTKSPVIINSEEGMAILDAYVEGIKMKRGAYPKMIIVDTLDRNFDGDENSSPSMSAFVTALSAIREKTEASIVVVHHTAKGNSDAARGSNVLRSGVDTEMRVNRDSEENIIFENTKMKDQKDGGSMTFKYKVVKVGFDEKHNEDITSLILYTNKKVKEIKKTIEKLTSNLDEIKIPFKNQKVVLAEAMKLADKESQVSLETLVDHMKSIGKTRKQTLESISGLSSKGFIKLDNKIISKIPDKNTKIV